jgi:hypothetical protein
MSLWNRHQSGLEVNMIGKIAPIMTFEMLLRKFYDHERPDTVKPDTGIAAKNEGGAVELPSVPKLEEVDSIAADQEKE